MQFYRDIKDHTTANAMFEELNSAMTYYEIVNAGSVYV